MRILTLNLWGDNGPVEQRMPALIDYLCAERFDVLALQEVEHWRGRSQAQHLAEAAGYAHVHEVRTARWLRGEGLAVLTSLDSEALETVSLPRGWRDQARALQQVSITTASGEAVRVANTHLA